MHNDSYRICYAASSGSGEKFGWIEGRNIRFEVRWSGGEIKHMRTFASELVKLAPCP